MKKERVSPNNRRTDKKEKDQFSEKQSDLTKSLKNKYLNILQLPKNKKKEVGP